MVRRLVDDHDAVEFQSLRARDRYDRDRRVEGDLTVETEPLGERRSERRGTHQCDGAAQEQMQFLGGAGGVGHELPLGR